MGIDVTAVGLPAMDILTWVLAILPIVVILALMLALKVSGARSGIIAWVLTGVIVYFVFQGGPEVIAAGTVKGFWSTLFVLYIIWSSMFLYNVVNETGSFKTIADKFTEMTNGSRVLQILILGWAFPTFIQGVCGFGVPVAVATPLLIGLGFDPMVSVITALLGHSWGVAFGSLGSMYNTMLNNLPEAFRAEHTGDVAFWGAVMVAFGGLIVGFCIIHNYGVKVYKNVGKAFAEGTVAVLFLSIVMGATIIGMSFVAPELGCFVSGAVGLILGVLVLPRLGMYKSAEGADATEHTSWGDFLKAFSAYIILLVVVFAVYLITPIKTFLESPAFQIGLAFPANSIASGFTNAAVEKYSAIKIFTAPGTLIFLTSFLAILFYKSQSMLKQGAVGEAWSKTIKQSIGSTTTIIPMTMMAVLLTEAGMTTYIAYGIAIVAGSFYPILAPFIAILGGFVTSSGTSSNILFTALQYNVADVLGISAPIVLSEQSAAAALSNSFSPGNAALGTGVSNQAGREGEILAATGVYNILQGLLVGILAFILISMGLGL